MPLLFTLYLGNIIFCSHTHVVNGVVIVHSHPFKNSHHSHTEAELETVFFLTHFTSTGSYVAFILPLFIPVVLCLLTARPCCHIKKQRFDSGISLRAPPATALA